MSVDSGLDVLLAALAEGGTVGTAESGDPVVTTPDGREVVVLLTEDDWDDLTSGTTHTTDSAVTEVVRLVTTSTAARAYLVAWQYSVWLSPYDPGRR